MPLPRSSATGQPCSTILTPTRKLGYARLEAVMIVMDKLSLPPRHVSANTTYASSGQGPFQER